MLSVGAVAPEIAAPTTRGVPFALSHHRGRPVVVYFYPKAGTSGCTIEAREFAEHYSDLERAGVVLVGVSVDRPEDQQRFAESCRLPFPLIPDPDGSIARRYGVLGILGIARRVTFWVGPDGRVEAVHSGMLPRPHVRAVLERLGPERTAGADGSAPPR